MNNFKLSLGKPVLVVDLDGTLLRSDILFETFWNSIRFDWLTPIKSILVLFRGKAAFKRYLVLSSKLNIKTLPYDDEVIKYIKAWRNDGGRTALVTASDDAIAQKIANHLNIFDDCFGSDGLRNLKGAVKSKFICEIYSNVGFVYMGDSSADLSVWMNSKQGITVNAAKSLRRKVEKIGIKVEHMDTANFSFFLYFKALRPHQWLKNILVFIPMVTAHQYDFQTFLQSLLSLIVFSMIASSSYVLNDLLDLAADRDHPRKCKRPFASGDIPINHGAWMVFGLLLIGAVVAANLGWLFFTAMLFYFITATAYSIYFKSQIIIDICILAVLYTTRIGVGGLATEIYLSFWLLSFSTFFFFSLAAVKRQAELRDSAIRGKLFASGRGYNVEDVTLISQIAIGSGYVSILIMALYINSPAVVAIYRYPTALWGICLILLYWITNIIMVTHHGDMHDDPLVYAAKDRISQICLVVIIGLTFGAYFL